MLARHSPHREFVCFKGSQFGPKLNLKTAAREEFLRGHITLWAWLPAIEQRFFASDVQKCGPGKARRDLTCGDRVQMGARCFEIWYAADRVCDLHCQGLNGRRVTFDLVVAQIVVFLKCLPKRNEPNARMLENLYQLLVHAE